ncbi:recombination-associated protein RdgC [Cognatazoarcus halotolerans]|uniref:recombination-associated protein RdgC n=1 Tax=Cognatazoarcus halotolerans TaxID=2686016 RepID=UPI0013578CC7|nr:recombination-associated protein RdgC [Cognatazoarcus halotolerans]MBX3679612.1 recombination-associated protein RdgC [Rhodocyclaceae bacterium]MCB1898675.1 recombination-associated protein RdgC [Rhodocyclaceae bacterium]MCP5309060.1 recombination-associated protein RdgC [Zoogloeaceae bacterium]
MWFKNLLVYRLPAPWSADPDAVSERLARFPLQRCGGGDRETRGWVSPRNDERLLYTVNGQWLLALGQEQKLLPSSVVNEFVKDRAAEIEEQQGYKPGRKQMKELKERVTEELLPRAFVRRRIAWLWIDPVNGWLVVDASSPGRADEVLELLRETLDELPVRHLDTETSVGGAMTEWVLSGEAPSGFTVDRDLELRAPDEEKATVRYVRHALEGDEVGAHIAAGKRATRLALTWADRISFVLTDTLQIKRLAFLDVLKEQLDQVVDGPDAEFDASFALMTGELARLLPELVEALGGERAPVV